MSILAHAEDSTLSVIIRYPSRALTRDDAQRIAGHWRQVIEQVTANPDASIGALPFLGAAEREVVRASRNGATAVSRSGAMLDLISEQAARQPDLVAARSGTAEITLATDGEVEEVRQIWREVLKVRDIGIRDNLFDFGVDSLAVIRISSLIYRKTGIDIPLEIFYDSPTIIDISNIIARARREG